MHFKTTTYSPSAYDCWLCTLLCRSTSLSPSITCVGMIYPVTTSPSLSDFGPSPVTHLSRHLPAKVQLCHWFSSTAFPPTQSTSCPAPVCHQGLNLSLLMEPVTVSLYKLPQICDLSYGRWPMLLRKIGFVLSRSERNTRGEGMQGCHFVQVTAEVYVKYRYTVYAVSGMSASVWTLQSPFFLSHHPLL